MTGRRWVALFVVPQPVMVHEDQLRRRWHGRTVASQPITTATTVGLLIDWVENDIVRKSGPVPPASLPLCSYPHIRGTWRAEASADSRVRGPNDKIEVSADFDVSAGSDQAWVLYGRRSESLARSAGLLLRLAAPERSRFRYR
jgi:hypothetical protein